MTGLRKAWRSPPSGKDCKGLVERHTKRGIVVAAAHDDMPSEVELTRENKLFGEDAADTKHGVVVGGVVTRARSALFIDRPPFWVVDMKEVVSHSGQKLWASIRS